MDHPHESMSKVDLARSGAAPIALTAVCVKYSLEVMGGQTVFSGLHNRAKTTYTTVIMTTLACPKRHRSLSGSKIDPSSAHATVGTFRATTRQRAAKCALATLSLLVTAATRGAMHACVLLSACAH